VQLPASFFIATQVQHGSNPAVAATQKCHQPPYRSAEQASFFQPHVPYSGSQPGARAARAGAK